MSTCPLLSSGNEAIAELLMKNGANVNYADNDLNGPLHLAAKYGER